jgi:hypothetical protein
MVISTVIALFLSHGTYADETAAEAIKMDGDAPAAGPFAALKLERQAVAEEMLALAKRRASPEEMAACRAKDAALNVKMREKIAQLYPQQDPGDVPAPPLAESPADASSAMKEFISALNAFRQDQSQKLNALSRGREFDRAVAMRILQTETAAARQNLQRLARQVAEENRVQPIPEPPPPEVPDDATPELRTFLRNRHTQMVEETAILNQIRILPPKERLQALAALQQKATAEIQKSHPPIAQPSAK